MTHLKSLGFLVLLLGFSFYSYWYSNRDFEWVVPAINERNPAAVRDASEVKDVLEKPMRVFKRESVAASIRIHKNKENQMIFSMGQFAVGGQKGPNLLCLEYSQVRLRFKAEGTSVSAESPRAVVQAPCHMNSLDKEYLSEIPLPFQDMSRWPAQSQEVDFGSDGHKSHIIFESVLGDWPSQWRLESVEFLKDQEALTISSEEITKKLGAPLIIVSK